MSVRDKTSNKAQDIKGKAKEALGKVTGNTKLEREGKTDETESAVKDVGEHLKDAASAAKDALTK